MELYKQFILRHAGTAEGLNYTTRVMLWYEVDTPQFRMYLEGLCDNLGIQGVRGIVPCNTETAKAILIISNDVNVANASAMWIEEVNSLLAKQPLQLLEYFARNVPAEEMSAVSASSSSGVSRDSSGMYSDA